MIKNLLQLITITTLLFVVVNSQQQCQNSSEFKNYVTIQSMTTGKTLQSISDLYYWTGNSRQLETTNGLTNDHNGYFFLEFNSTESLTISNNYIGNKTMLILPQTNGFSNNTLVLLNRLTGNYLYENTTSYNVDYSETNFTVWKINYLNNICSNVGNTNSSVYYPNNTGSLCSNIQFGFQNVKITSVIRNRVLDVSGTTPYQISFNDYNKVIKTSLNVSSIKNTTFTMIPVENGRFALQDMYGNHLSSLGNSSAIMIQNLAGWEKLNLYQVTNKPNQYYIYTNVRGYLVESDTGILTFSYYDKTAFQIELLSPICPPAPNVTTTPNVTSTPSNTPIPNKCVFNGIDYSRFDGNYSSLNTPTNSQPTGKYRYYWNICNSTPYCPGDYSMACQKTLSNGIFDNIGVSSLNYTFSTDSSKNTVLIYKTNSTYGNKCGPSLVDRVFKISFVCSDQDSISTVSEYELCTYVVTMKSSSYCNSSIPTTSPNVTTTPNVTVTPYPTTSPNVTATPNVTITPYPTSPNVTATPNVTVTPYPTTSPNVTATPNVTITPYPTSSPNVTATPNVTITPVPTSSPNVTITPVPTLSPSPNPNNASKVICSKEIGVLEMTSHLPIVCKANGITNCEFADGSTCSTDYQFGSIKCTTKSGSIRCSSSGSLVCESNYLSCSATH